MPRPTSPAVHVDRALTNISVALLQSAENFAAMRTFPRVPVQHKSDEYFVYNRGDFNRDQAQLRAPGTESAGGGYGLNTQSYTAKVYAVHKDLDDQTVANSDSVLRPMQDATQWVTHQMLIRLEKDWANEFFKTGVWGTDVVGGTDFTQWSDLANSDPIKDVRDGKTTVAELTGLMPNKMTMDLKTFHTLLDHPDVIDRIKFGQTAGSPATADRNTLAQLFGLDEIVISTGVENTADQGQSDSHSFVLGDNALLTFTPDSPGIAQPAAGYMFAWRNLLGGINDMGFAIKQFRMDELEAERIEGQGAWDHEVVSAPLGYFFSNTLA